MTEKISFGAEFRENTKRFFVTFQVLQPCSLSTVYPKKVVSIWAVSVEEAHFGTFLNFVI